jgi:hypothetical protein
MVVRGHYDDDRYMWAIIIRRFYDTSLEFFMGKNPVHSWMNDGGTLNVVTFLKASLWN